MNYPKKQGFNLYESRHCAYITYSLKNLGLKNLSICFIFNFFSPLKITMLWKKLNKQYDERTVGLNEDY